MYKIIITLAALILSTPLYAGKNVTMCRDADGDPYFTDTGCPTDTTEESEFYARSADSYGGLTSYDKQLLDEEARKLRRKKELRRQARIHNARMEAIKPVCFKETVFTSPGKTATRKVCKSPTAITKKTAVPKNTNLGAVNTLTGEYYAPAGDGFVSTRDGTLFVRSGPNGVINTRTGKFVPTH